MPNKSSSRSHVKSLDITPAHTDLSPPPLQGHGWLLPCCGSTAAGATSGQPSGGVETGWRVASQGLEDGGAGDGALIKWRRGERGLHQLCVPRCLRPTTGDGRRFVSERRCAAFRTHRVDAICLTSYEIKCLASAFCQKKTKKKTEV